MKEKLLMLTETKDYKETTVLEFKKAFGFDPAPEFINNGIVMCYNCKQNPAIIIPPVVGHCRDCVEKQNKWSKENPQYKHKPTTDEKMEGMSPEEVLSGVQSGGQLSFEEKTKEGHTKAHTKAVGELKEALNDI